jgi:hypothetical protein
LVSSKQDNKEKREREIFEKFLTHACWPCGSFESRPVPEPDILYNHSEEGNIAFELIEICAPEIKTEVSKLRNDNDSNFIWASNTIPEKISKNYQIYIRHNTLLNYSATQQGQ